MEGSRRPERQVGREQLEEFVEEIFGEELHAKRVASLIDGVDGVRHAASLGIRAIGQGLAVAPGLGPKHAIKQVDRRLSNAKLGMEPIFRCGVPFVVAERAESFVNFAWTEFEASDQCMVVLGMPTGHGRSTPLVWKSVTRSALKDQRHDHEDAWLTRFATVVPEGVRVTGVADRGFSDRKLDRFLSEERGFDDIIRFRAVVDVEVESGELRQVGEWVGRGGRMRVLCRARVTAQRHEVPVVVCVQEAAMQAAWCLASSREDLTGGASKTAYGRRFTVAETVRDVKNPRFGVGLQQTVVRRNDRREALCLLAVRAHTLLTLLGKAGQELGRERMLGATCQSPPVNAQRLSAMLPNGSPAILPTPIAGHGAQLAGGLPGSGHRSARELLSGWVWVHLLSFVGSVAGFSEGWRSWARKLRPVITRVSA